MADEFPEELVRRCAAIISAENDIAPPAAWDAAIAVLREIGYAALRQRADEATRNENIGCAALVERLLQRTYPLDSAYEPIIAAIRARINPERGSGNQ